VEIVKQGLVMDDLRKDNKDVENELDEIIDKAILRCADLCKSGEAVKLKLSVSEGDIICLKKVKEMLFSQEACCINKLKSPFMIDEKIRRSYLSTFIEDEGDIDTIDTAIKARFKQEVENGMP
jgi:hypothetical protein